MPSVLTTSNLPSANAVALGKYKRQILDSARLKDFADDNLNLMNMTISSPKGRKHCGKRRNCSLRAISPFPTVFSKDLYCRLVKTRACLGKG